MKRKILNTSKGDFVLGRDILLESVGSNAIFLSEYGDVVCFLGYQVQNQSDDILYYDPGVASRDKAGRESYRFITLRDGAIKKSGFLRDDVLYKEAKRNFLKLPSGSIANFGVMSKEGHVEHNILTRKLFGGTSEEITKVATSYAKAIGRFNFMSLPHITFSKARNNNCDHSGCVIPKRFPYLAFAESGHDWGHVSLFGFYRLLAFSCASSRGAPLRNNLLDDGVDRALLDRLIECGKRTRIQMRGCTSCCV